MREELDAILQALPAKPGSREISLVKTNLEEARMWLGSCLRENNPSEDPYRPLTTQRMHGNTREIAPRADTAKTPTVLPEDKIEMCDTLRKSLNEHITEVKELHTLVVERNDPSGYWLLCFTEEAVKSLTLTRNYLGLELGRIRDESLRSDFD